MTDAKIHYLPGNEPQPDKTADVLMHPTFDRVDAEKTKQPNYLLRRVVAGGVGAIALLGVAAGLNWVKDQAAPHMTGLFEDRPDVDPATLTVKYDPQPNETIWEVAEDRTPDTESVEPLRNELSRQAALDGAPGLQMDETLMVPEYQDPQSTESTQPPA